MHKSMLFCNIDPVHLQLAKYLPNSIQYSPFRSIALSMDYLILLFFELSLFYYEMKKKDTVLFLFDDRKKIRVSNKPTISKEVLYVLITAKNLMIVNKKNLLTS